MFLLGSVQQSVLSQPLNSIYMEGKLWLKKCNTKWPNLKAFLAVILSPFTCAVNHE